MGNFIITLMSVALLRGAVGMITPEGDIKKYVRLLGSLCLLCALVSPIYGAITEGELTLDELFPDHTEREESYEQIYGDALAQGAEKTIEASVKARIIEKFELADGDLDVKIFLAYDGEKYLVDSAEVTLHHSAVFADPRQISALVNELCGCACTVIYD